MSKEQVAYEELQPGDVIQPGDEWQNDDGRWQPLGFMAEACAQVRDGLMARRPIRTTHQTAYEEVPGSRTTQETVIDPQRERIAYEELQPGDIIQEGDEWQNECGRWQRFLVLDGSRVQVRQSQRVRRPYNITRMENDRAEAIAEVAKLSAELWARKPLEDRVASLTEELANAREGIQDLLKTIADNADQFAEHTASLVQQRDGFDAEVQRLQEVVRNLYNEPTARQVQDTLRTWATELDWSVGCFGSFGRSQIDIIQQTMVAVIQRIEGMVNLEGGTDGE